MVIPFLLVSADRLQSLLDSTGVAGGFRFAAVARTVVMVFRLPNDDKMAVTSPCYPDPYSQNISVRYLVMGPTCSSLQSDTQFFDLGDGDSNHHLALEELFNSKKISLGKLTFFTHKKGGVALRSATNNVVWLHYLWSLSYNSSCMGNNVRELTCM